jgi:hypothetical protein
VEPEATPWTTLHFFGIGVAAFLVIQEHDQTEHPDAADLRPEPVSAFGAGSQHPLMLASQRVGGMGVTVQ